MQETQVSKQPRNGLNNTDMTLILKKKWDFKVKLINNLNSLLKKQKLNLKNWLKKPVRSENKDNKKKQDRDKKTESDLQKKCKKLKESLSNKLWRDKLNSTRFKNKKMRSTKEDLFKIWDVKEMPNLVSNKRKERTFQFKQRKNKENCHYLNKYKSNANKLRSAIMLIQMLREHSLRLLKFTLTISLKITVNKSTEE